jgi:carbon-monoxide dehydrogenase small subunit
MSKIINLTVNGEKRQVIVDPGESLLDVLRLKLHLTGTKKGCNEGDCGACTIIMNKRPVNACLVLAVEADNADILTIEGLADKAELHPLQTAFVKYGGLQCGFCTPGMIMISKALLDQNPNPTDEEIRKAIAGNVCRCTGYVKIVQSISEAAKVMRGEAAHE